MIRSDNKRIGIFGGSFDPPHHGHLKISKLAIKKLLLDQVYWCVTKKNPFKKKTFFSLPERIKKSKIITNKVKKIKIKFFEDKIKSTNTVDLIKYLKKKNKKNIFFLIIGSDNLIKFHKWKNWKLMLELSKIVVFSRKDYDKKAKKSVIMKLVKKITFINNKPINISSTQIKKKIT
ncbi:nicotinate (nicotinamide) nucleotide adenylyltransferase [Pelagibacteraceae bacterium]|nr:nicotinate (nicotinamide) nucleotide adenylyltransferase [Pelagibacteraceae bacterium]